jgi:hypothetical protein
VCIGWRTGELKVKGNGDASENGTGRGIETGLRIRMSWRMEWRLEACVGMKPDRNGMGFDGAILGLQAFTDPTLPLHRTQSDSASSPRAFSPSIPCWEG